MRYRKDMAVASYEERGYLVVPDLLAPSECAALIERFMDIHSGRRPLEGFEPRDPEAPVEVLYKRLFATHMTDPESLRLMTLPTVKAQLQGLIGAEPAGIQSMFFFKAPGGPGQAAHQDTTYIHSDPESLTACWIALDDVTEDNGPLWVIPGSHRGPLLEPGDVTDTDEYEDWTHQVNPADLSREEPVLVRAGSAVFFHGRLIHRSSKNRSDRFRRAHVCHYVARGAWVARPDLRHQTLL